MAPCQDTRSGQPTSLDAGRQGGELKVPRPTAEDRAARASAATILAPLDFLHPDGTPVTLADCITRYREISADNIARSRRLKELERSETPDKFEYQELCEAARLGNLMARAWSALEGLARLTQEGEA